MKNITTDKIIKSFVGVQGAVFQKSPLAAGGSMLLFPFCTADAVSFSRGNISNSNRVHVPRVRRH